MTEQPKPALRSEGFMEHAIATHRASVIQLALSQTRSSADAQDIAQDVFVRLLQSTTKFEDEGHLRAWLLRVTHNRCVDLHRQAWRRHVDMPGDLGDIADDAEHGTPYNDLVSHPIWIAMARIPEKPRAALHLHYVEGYPIEKAAHIMGCSTATARVRLHRGRKRLFEELQTLDAGPEGREGRSKALRRAASHARSPRHTG